MPQITGIKIPADEHQALERVQFERGDLPAMYELIDCRMFDALDIEELKCTLWLDDEGKLVGKPVNSRATTLLWAFSKPWVGHDFLVGNILVTGLPNKAGNTRGVPDELLKLLFDTRMFKVEVQTDGPSWDTNNMVFTDWFSAASFVIDLGLRWGNVTGTRIAPARP